MKCEYCGKEIAQGGICDCPDATAQVQKKSAESEPQAFNPYGAGDPVQNGTNVSAGSTPVNYAPSGAGNAGYAPPFGNAPSNASVPQGKIDFSKIGKDFGVTVDTDKVKGNINGALNKISGGDVEQENNSIYERGMKIVPDSINANDGEVPIKQYNFARLRTRYLFAKAEGRLQVTNKRILFRATGRSIMGKSTLHQEFEISQIGGVEFRTRYDFNLLSLIGGMLVTAFFGAIGFGLASLIVDKADSLYFAEVMAIIFQFLTIGGCAFGAYYLKKIKSFNKYFTVRQILMSPGIGALIGYATGFSSWYTDGFDNEALFVWLIILAIPALINLILISFVPDLVAVIKTKGAIPGIEIKKENPQALLAFLFSGRHDDSNSGFMEVLPWTDTELAIKEVGTIVDDIQTMGDAAIEKWQVKEY